MEVEEIKKENRRTGSDGERIDDDENMSGSSCDSFPSTSKSPCSTSQLLSALAALNGIKQSVVVLTRLPDYKISALRPPTPQQFYSEDESLSSSDSDMQWELDDDSTDSDFALSKNKQKLAKGKAESNAASRSPVPQTSTSSSSTSNNNSAPEPGPVIISAAFAMCSKETTMVRPNLPDIELMVDMMVVARKKPLRWQRGKIVEIVTKEDGRVKYKVSFDEKGKSLVSGHHVAHDTTPKLDQLYVGARVAVRCPENKFRFMPGLLAELPSRKNRLRFLVFTDDHVPIYVGLPLLHLVCRPLDDALDDVPEGTHRDFMRQYLKDWPYPHLTQYRVGQTLNAELNGAMQRCEVQVVDSSIIQVQFEATQQKEWIHRGSIRLEHMARFLEMKEMEVRNDDDDDDDD